MSALEQEIASEAKQADTSPFDYAAWFRNIEVSCQQIRANDEEQPLPLDVVRILRDIRDGDE